MKSERDPFLLSYNATDLQNASEFLSTWLPFLSKDLCPSCTQILSHRIRSIHPDGGDEEDNCDTNSLGSWKDGDTADTNSLGSWKDGVNGWSESLTDASTSETVNRLQSPKVRMSWADMAQEDEFDEDEDGDGVGDERNEASSKLVSGDAKEVVKVTPKTELSRDQREHIRFNSVRRKKDFICLERLNGKIVNILDGLELHTGVFSAAEQKRIVDLVYEFQERGRNGELRERTYTAPQKWMKGKGRVTIQFGCCYNYATDKNGNPPGILQKELVDPIPDLFKVIIKRLVKWHVLPPTCVPDSCIVNIYDEGDCIPPHIDNHDFVRPFCTVSFLSECNIVFGLNLKIVGAGEFDGSIAIPLPVGSVLVLNGNGADLAKHCVPAVPTKRISITFRKMDESKWPIGFVPEPDLQGLQPLSCEDNRSKHNFSNFKRPVNRQTFRREDNSAKTRGSTERKLEPLTFGRIRQGPANRQRVRVNLDH